MYATVASRAASATPVLKSSAGPRNVAACATTSGRSTMSGRSTQSGRSTMSGRSTQSGKTPPSPPRTQSNQGSTSVLDEFYGADRRTWLPDTEPPSWLDGTMAGDHGYDVLGICSNPKTIDQFRRGEVINSRFCMLGVVGMLVPEILQANGADIKGAVWFFESGAAMLNGGKLNYLGVEIPLTLQAVIISNAALVFLAEWFRWQEFAPGYEPDCDDTLYPGGPFDPLGLADDKDEFMKLKVNEIRNGRLAKIAFLGMIWQAYITREGPWKNWTDFLADPGGNNIFTRWPSDPTTLAL